MTSFALCALLKIVIFAPESTRISSCTLPLTVPFPSVKLIGYRDLSILFNLLVDNESKRSLSYVLELVSERCLLYSSLAILLSLARASLQLVIARSRRLGVSAAAEF